jgi:serine/threonine-protein kinase
MRDLIGHTLGHYRVVEKIGEGGMGEVYRAHDERLGRDVAIKVLPEAVAEDVQRLARFEREAKVLGSLSHQNIATLYDLEEHQGQRFLVMELAEGETLAERIKRGPIPVDDALEYALQIAEGLEAAHKQGIIHRDLKPANLMLSPDGKVKVLDFGLAKAWYPDESNADLTHSPTLTGQITTAGVLLGSAGYMSPEQARGKPADKRVDIWAFGCVLWEMLTGKRLFTGASATDALARILEREPDWGALPVSTPREVRRLLSRCLAKDPRNRLRDIGDAWLEISESDAEEVDRAALTVSHRPRTHLVLGGLIGLVLGIAIGGVVFLMPSSSTVHDPLPQARFSVTLPDNGQLQTGDQPETTLSIAPDGSRLVYVGGEDWRDTRLFTRTIDGLEIRPIPGTEGARQPFFSPDSRWLAFFNRLEELKKVSLSGGDPVTLLRGVDGGEWAFGSWGDDGKIVFSTWGMSGLKRVSAEGGAVASLAARETVWPLNPEVLPGSKVVLYTAESEDGPRVVARQLDTGDEQTLIENAANAGYLPSGHLLFSRDGAPMVVGFDLDRVVTTGPTVPIDENVRIDSPILPSAIPLMSASKTGTLVFAPAVEEIWRGTLVWVNRQGEVEEVGPVPTISVFQLSPDGRRVALTFKQGQTVRLDIFDLERKVSTPHFEGKSIIAMMPVWFPDGRYIAFSQCNTVEGSLYRHGVEGGETAELLLQARSVWGVTPWSITPDGRYLAYTPYEPEAGGSNIYFHSLDEDREPLDFLVTPTDEIQPAFSPDGRWIVYTSNESGPMEIYVREFPSGRNKRKVSVDGGWAPRWSPNGTEIFYQGEDGRSMMVVEIDTGPELRISDPRLLFEGPFQRSTDIGYAYDVSPDGRRFLMMQVSEDREAARELVVVLNWFEELKRLVPTE